MVADRARYADPTRFSERLQSGRDVYAIAVDVAVFNNDVAEIDTDAEYDPLILRRCRVALGHALLHRDRARDGLNDAWELDQNTVASGLDDAALVGGDARIDQFMAMGSEPCESTGLVLAHQPAISRDVRR